jgi:hypothetical protein
MLFLFPNQSLFANMLKLKLNTNYIYSRSIGMIKPQRTQRKQRKGREMNDSDTNGFDITFSICEYVEA